MPAANVPICVLGLLAGLSNYLVEPPPPVEERSVSVVAVLATDKNNQVDPRLKTVAEEVQKLEPSLTGFRVAQTSCKALTVGRRETFVLVDKEVLTVLIQEVGADKKPERTRLTVKAPLAGEITYSTCCSKFFPILTRYLTKDNERLIVAVMVKPVKKN